MQEPNGSPMPKGPRTRGPKKQSNGDTQHTPAKTPQRAPRHIHQPRPDMQHRSPSYNAQPNNSRQTRSTHIPHQETPTVDTGLDGTPSRTIAQASTPIKQMAYAGPTFHASPAPSSLPIPRFFSKSVPNPASQSGLQARLDASPSRVPPSPSPQPTSATPIRREESPLDLLFNAHRAEQAKQHVSSPLMQQATPSSGAGSRRMQPSGREMFMMEMDGTGEHTDAVDTTPFRERLDAARAIPKTNSSSTQADMDEWQRMQKTAALKNLLRVQPMQSTGTGVSGLQMDGGSGHHANGNGERQAHLPPSYLHPYGSSASNGFGHAAVPTNVQAMEADLRRILKLGPS